MKSGLLESFVFLSLMASGQTILPLRHGKENASGRNNLPEVFSPDTQSVSTSTSSFTYECLYVSSDLPPCDIERMEDSAEDIMHSGMVYRETKESPENFGKDKPSRWRKSVDDSARRHVIVYSIEGCLPPSLPFTMPACQDKNSLDKIVEVRKLYPFTVKGLTKPPLVFPEFNFDRWIRMIRRLRNRVSSAATGVGHRDVNLATSSDKSEGTHRRSDAFMKTTTANEITPKTMISSTSTWTGSSPSKFILPNKKRPAEGGNTQPEQVEHVSLLKNVKAEGNESDGSTNSPGIERTSDEDVRSSFRAALDGMKTYKRNEDTRGKKASESYKANLHAYQSSKVLGKNEERWKRIPSNDREITPPIRNNKDATLGKISEIPIPPSLFRKSHKSMEGSLSDPRALGNSLNALKTSDKVRENDEFTYSKASSSNGDEVVASGSNDLPSSLEAFAESLRRRREIRVTDELIRQAIRHEAKAQGIVGKSQVQRSREPRETVNSQINGLNVASKWNRYFKGKSAAPNKQENAGKYSGNIENEPLKGSQGDNMENFAMKSRSDFPYPPRDSRGKIAALGSSEVISRKALMGKIAMRKKYADYPKLRSRYGRPTWQ